MDWDLQAIVRGKSSETTSTIMDDPIPIFNDLTAELDHTFSSFPDISETRTVLGELEELYKPFYPVLHPLSTTQTIVATRSVPGPQDVNKSEKAVQGLHDSGTESKHKRSEKKQNKRVVKEVTADNLMDTWAWRKYGQKPIKGSPYPRSYYKCSSSKGCSARKQVERSHLKPGVFIITYTAEHSHVHPTGRNSLAGSIQRSKLITKTLECTEETCSPSSTALFFTPSTTLVESVEDENIAPTCRIGKLKRGSCTRGR